MSSSCSAPSLPRRLLGGRLASGLAAGLAFCACGRPHQALAAEPAQPPPPPGEPTTARSRALEGGAALLQSQAPPNALDMYLNGFHFYADDLGRAVEAHHYCTHLSEELHQCAIFDGPGAGARLIGIEYIVSERLFRALPEAEKPLWHSHHFETTSGQLVMPGVPEAVETTVMRQLATTYGKTWHTWQVDRGDALPLGIPQLMMGFTGEGQLDPARLAARDQAAGLSSAGKRRARSDIPVPHVAPGANAWESGETPQLALERRRVRGR
ncbi:OBAP family protein [Pseudoroseomonas cervicalis]|uniref:OBAP family protein n=1 Tax=Teichococcus cervicalis TaxID=204525 RepID=UPI0022F167D1|nr:OBAP family protein [Pseudoroseomonas cervicalis]WBV44820.1 OBAP family protein [Pseudoroseomonas cervicalis]